MSPASRQHPQAAACQMSTSASRWCAETGDRFGQRAAEGSDGIAVSAPTRTVIVGSPPAGRVHATP
jgi:hypothetical protein